MENQVTNITISKKEKVVKRTTSYRPDQIARLAKYQDLSEYGRFSQSVQKGLDMYLAYLEASEQKAS